MLETERLILRRWEESDAKDLYSYACDPDVGPIAGWPAHQSVEESREIIRNVFCGAEAYAICLKENRRAIGAIELKLKGHTAMTDREDECELGYWLGKPFWGRGIMPEAAGEILRHAFEELGMTKVWCGYYAGNEKSKRVQEKCGFVYQYRKEDVEVSLLHERRTEYVNLMTREDWELAGKKNGYVRRAVAGDIPRILELLVQVDMVHHTGRPDLFKGPATKYNEKELAEIIGNDLTPVFVYEKEKKVLGHAFCIHKQIKGDSVLTDIKTLYIDDICVDEAARGSGAGKALYRYVEAYAGRQGYYNITLNVWTCNPGAMRFYEAMGMQPQKIGMEKIL